MNVAFIPVRGGSKSIPLKNIKEICGKPLIFWSLKAACGCKYIDKVYVATDSDAIREKVELMKNDFSEESVAKIQVINRSEESASDTASTEYAMLEFAGQYEFENIVLIQATSPMLTSNDLDRGFVTYDDTDTDSVLSVVRQKRFHWKKDDNGFAIPTNYDMFSRPRRQEFEGDLIENGAFYITSKENLLRTKNRISGHIRAVEMNEDTFFEIDEPSDWVIIEELMKKKGMMVPLEIPKVKMFLTDCDGCLTDAGMYYSEQGDELKKFNARDGMGFKLLKEAGIITGIVTGESVKLNSRRAQKLQLDILKMGCKDKVEVIRCLCKQYDINLENVVYVGDDINDLEVIKIVGFGCAPADAVEEVKRNAKYVTVAKGGQGVIREVVERIRMKF